MDEKYTYAVMGFLAGWAFTLALSHAAALSLHWQHVQAAKMAAPTEGVPDVYTDAFKEEVE